MTDSQPAPFYDHTVYESIQRLLQIEENLVGKPVTIIDIMGSQARRKELHQWMEKLHEPYTALQRRIRALPSHPDLHQIAMAQFLLRRPDLGFLEIETDSIDYDANILQAMLMDRGGVYQSVLFQTDRPVTNSEYHGLDSQLLLKYGYAREEAWSLLQQAFQQRYILFWGDFDAQVLFSYAQRYNLPPLPFVGENFQEKAHSYFGRVESRKGLVDLVALTGEPLPQKSTAEAKCLGQIRLLNLMAEGGMDRRKPELETSSSAPADDFDPFLDSDDLP